MGYLKIANLYRPEAQIILAFKEVFALEKCDGTSSHLTWDGTKISFFAGGSSHENFVKLFDVEKLTPVFTEMGHTVPITVFGEAYGGKLQGMSHTYGKELCFIAFDVKIGDSWLDVPTAERVTISLGLEFVPYEKGPAELAWIDSQRDADSTIAIRRGMGPGHIREGVVLRPPFEVALNNDGRCMAKHKRDEFRETKTPRVVDDPEKLAVLSKADEVAEEWITPNRLDHIIQKIEGPIGIERMRDIIAAMTNDILVEGAGEFVDSKEVRKAIGNRTVKLFKEYLRKDLVESVK